MHDERKQLARSRFQSLIENRGENIDLAEAALLIAQNEYPDLDVSHYLELLHDMGESLSMRIGAEVEPREVIDSINAFLFDDLGFNGNVHDYYDPRNSYLNDVIERRTGLPITLSLLYMDLSKRVGFEIAGVGMPGHFVVKHCSDSSEIVVDPFNRGQILSEADCRKRVEELSGGRLGFKRCHLRPATTREILSRILANLKSTHIRRNRIEKAIENIGWILMIRPDAASEYRDRGLLLSQLERWCHAAPDLERYLQLQPGAADEILIRERLQEVRRAYSRLN